MKKCENCIYWNKKDIRQAKAMKNSLGKCEKALMMWDCVEWKHDEDYDYYLKTKPEFENQNMFVQDGSDYKACLYTTEGFYCKDFKNKK